MIWLQVQCPIHEDSSLQADGMDKMAEGCCYIISFLVSKVFGLDSMAALITIYNLYSFDFLHFAGVRSKVVGRVYGYYPRQKSKSWVGLGEEIPAAQLLPVCICLVECKVFTAKPVN